jgi:hypothetical protein
VRSECQKEKAVGIKGWGFQPDYGEKMEEAKGNPKGANMPAMKIGVE